MLRTTKQIKEDILASCDNKWRDKIYNSMLRAHGITNASGDILRISNIKIYPPIQALEQIVGNKTLLPTIHADLARTRLANIQPIFRGENVEALNKLKTEIFSYKVRGRSVYGGWSDDLDAAYVDSWWGVGWIRWVVDDNRVVARHSPILQTIYDLNAPTMDACQFIMFIDWVATEDAVSMFGPDAKRYERSRELSASNETRVLKAVPILSYYDVGIGENEPTHVVFLGNLENPVIEVANPHDCLPASPITLGKLAGNKHPIGRAFLAEPILANINEIEDSIDSLLKENRKIIFDPEYLNKEDINENGIADFVRFANSGVTDVSNDVDGGTSTSREYIRVIEAPAPNPLLLERLSLLERELIAATGISPLDFGTGYRSSKTATEITEIAAQAGAQRAFVIDKVRQSCIQMVYKWIKYAALYDTAPFTISVDKNNYQINFTPELSMASLFGEDYVTEVSINDDTIGRDENALKNQQRIAQLMQLLQIPNVNVQEVLSEIVTLMGLDPMKVIGSPQVPTQPQLPLV